MPNVNILYDWELNYEHKYNNKEKTLTKEEILINKIIEIQDNPIYRELMITKGHTYYQSRKLDRVPREAVEEILGIRFSNENRSE